jgi:hypothetical protein
MICDECRKKLSILNMTFFGDFCNECLPGSDARGRKLHQELLEEAPLSMPPMLKLDDFERFMLKFVLHYLKTMPEAERQRLRATVPALLHPMKMLLHLKDLVIEKLPLNYVSSMDAEGREKMFHGGTYQFKRLVPDTVVIKALIDAGVADPAKE